LRGSVSGQMQKLLPWKQVVRKSNHCSLKSYRYQPPLVVCCTLSADELQKRTRFSSVIRMIASCIDRKAHFRAAAGLRVWRTHVHAHTHQRCENKCQQAATELRWEGRSSRLAHRR
jgi:hypothetical protein